MEWVRISGNATGPHGNATVAGSNSNGTRGDVENALFAVMRLGGMIYYLLLIVGGTLGNIMAIIAIWTNRAMQKTRLVFIVLALSDTAVLLTNPPRYLVKFVSGFDVREFDVPACKAHTFLTYLVKDIATWVLVLISFERLLATWAPCHLAKYQASRLPAAIWTSVTVVLLLKNASLLYAVTLTTLPDGQQRTLCDCETRLLTFRQAFMWTDLFVYCLLPSLCLFVFNGGILYALHRSRKVNIRKHQLSTRRRDPLHFSPMRGATKRIAGLSELSAVGRGQCEMGMVMMITTKSLIAKSETPAEAVEERDAREQQLTRANSASNRSDLRSVDGSSRREAGARQSLATSLLIPISIFHLVTTLPIAVVSVVEAVYKIKHGSDQQLTDRIQTIGSFMVMLMYLNNGLNCLVYFVSSQRFRKHFIALLKGRPRLRVAKRPVTGVPSNASAYYGPVPAVYLSNSTVSSSIRACNRIDTAITDADADADAEADARAALSEVRNVESESENENENEDGIGNCKHVDSNASSSSIHPSESNLLVPHEHDSRSLNNQTAD